MNVDTFLDFSKRGNALIGQEMFKILDRAKEFERAGEHIYHLELGEPRIAPPEEIIEETIKGLQEKKVGYCSSAGLLELREKIAEYYSNPSTNIEVPNVAISPANLLISQFLDIVCDRGDRIALFPPLFPTYFAACNHIGLDTQYVPLSQENGFQLTEDHVDKALAYKPKAIIVNSGNNPTGAIYDKEVLTYLVNKCEEFGYWLLSDETYSKLNFKKDYFSLIDFEFPKLVIISSLSKIFAMPGFRTGFVIADPRVIDKVTLSSSTLYSCLPIFVQLGACRGVDLFDAFAKKAKTHYQKIIHECMEILNTSGAILCTEPDAGFYLFMDIRKTHLDDIDFAKQLLEQYKTAITPGESFRYKGFVRASICGEPEDVKEGIRRLVHFANVANNAL